MPGNGLYDVRHITTSRDLAIVRYKLPLWEEIQLSFPLLVVCQLRSFVHGRPPHRGQLTRTTLERPGRPGRCTRPCIVVYAALPANLAFEECHHRAHLLVLLRLCRFLLPMAPDNAPC